MVFFRCKSFIPAFWIIFFNVTVSVKALSESSDGNCLSILPESYDRTVPPRHKGKAANVFIQVEVLDLDEISEASMDFRMHCFIRTSWKDPRISLNTSDLSEDCVKDIWIPDLIFSEAKLIIETGQHNTYLTLRNGYFYMSIRYSFKVACMMDFHLYPFDTQHCEFSISFMSNDDSAAVPKWFDDEESPYRYKSVPVLVTKDIEPLQFIIGTLTTHSHPVKFMFANFTYLVANMTLSRRLIGSIVNYYMPSALCVLVSWVSFWLQSDASSERVTLTMTALLTICTQGDQYKSELPPVNYITAMDIWYFVCMSMLVATLLEFAFSYNASRKNGKKKTKKMKSSICCKHFRCLETSKDELGSEDPKETEEGATKLTNTTKMYRRIVNCVDTSSIDSVSKVLFPSFFITFSVVYWSYYCQFMHVDALDVDVD